MIFDQATGAQMQAARVVSGAAMVGFLGAGILGRRAQQVRLVVASAYMAGVVGFTLYSLF
jgi:uncharacterized membrane protein YhiD involved in acid resistance